MYSALIAAGSGGASSLTFSGSNDRVDSYSYDASGNLLSDGVHTYTYDAENRIIKVDGGSTASYVYNAEGQRVRKTVGGTSVDYLYDAAGHEMTEVSATGGWNRGEVYAGGRHIATYNNGTTYFNHADWLGTERVRTSMASAVCETIVNTPFGDGQAASGSCSDSSPMHFTGKQRDTETNLDDFGARYFTSTMGRWVTPDWSARPSGVPYADMSNPQTLNLYAYVNNNPVTHVDADGHAVEPANDFAQGMEMQGDSGGDSVFGETADLEADAELEAQIQPHTIDWTSLSAAQQALVTGGEKAWNRLSAERQDNFAAITHALEVTKLATGASALSEIKDVRSIGTRDIAVDWTSGAAKAFEDSGFRGRPGWGHSGESGMIGKPTAGGTIEGGFLQAQGIHVLFTNANKGATGNVHVDYRGLLSGHYGDANDDVRQNYGTYKKWFGSIPGYIP